MQVTFQEMKQSGQTGLFSTCAVYQQKQYHTENMKQILLDLREKLVELF